MRDNQRGFALLDVMLAVILMAIASYGTYMVAKSFRTASSVQTLEQRAITIAQNYMPFLHDTMTTTVIDQPNAKLANDFLTSIGIPETALVNTANNYSFVSTDLYCNSTNQSRFNFAQVLDNQYTAGGSFLAIGFTVTGAQLNQIIQDVSTTFSIYAGAPDAQTALSNATEMRTLVDKTYSGSMYSAYFIFPKTSISPGTSLSALAC